MSVLDALHLHYTSFLSWNSNLQSIPQREGDTAVASKRRQKRKQCGGKRRFATMREAEDAKHSLLRHKPSQGRMSAYKCDFCGGFHFGHTPAGVVKAMSARLQSVGY